MSTEVERQGNALATPDGPVADTLLACPVCNQEMLSFDDELPLHLGDGKLCAGSTTRGASPKFGEMIREPFIPADVFKSFSISEVLSSNTCLSCSGAKLPGQPVCGTCHARLPYVHQQALPPYMKGYLFADEKRLIAEHYTHKTFKEVFITVLERLLELRAGANENNNGKPETVDVTG